MAVTLYKRQRQIVDYLSQYIQKNGFSPTLQEIAKAIGVSSLATVHEHLQTLELKGVIKKIEGKVRGIKIVDDRFTSDTAGIELPILGRIAAGQPIQTFPDSVDTFQVSPSMVSSNKRSYVLQVKGESMIDDGILDGDYVVIEEQENVDQGDIVVALLDNGMATLKRFFKEATRIRLEPANANMSPIYATDVKVQGKVVGVIRKYAH